MTLHCNRKQFWNFVLLRFLGLYIWNDATSCSVLAFDDLCYRLCFRCTFKKNLQHYGVRSQTCLTTCCLHRFTVINHPGVNTGCIPLTWQRNNAALFFWGFDAIFVLPPDASPPAPTLNPPLFMNAINSGSFCFIQALRCQPVHAERTNTSGPLGHLVASLLTVSKIRWLKASCHVLTL